MAQTMSDDQVVDYIKEAMAQGKSQRQIATELASRGVTREQATRIQQQFGGGKQSGMTESSAVVKNRMRQTQPQYGAMESDYDQTKRGFEHNSERKDGKFDSYHRPDGLEGDMFVYDNETIIFNDERYVRVDDTKIFGRNIFKSRNLTFAPNQNLATPANHKLGPGDEVIIDIWGANQTTISKVISPDGFINIETLGVVYLSGKTVAEAEKYLRKRLSTIYSGVGEGEGAASQIKLSLGHIRTIEVHVMGEVVKPGTYSLSSLSNAFYALYHAGGVSKVGSLRDIRVMRNGKQVATVDVYNFVMQGKTTDNIHLQDGDVIIVQPYTMLVEVDGNVKRPMFYELTEGESIATLLDYAGSFTGNAYKKSVTVTRQNGREYQVFTVDDDAFAQFQLLDGDKVEIGAILDRFENRLEIKGAVYRAGVYQFNEQINSVKKLVDKAEGVLGDAFLARAVLQREREDLTLETIQVDLGNILNGTAQDIPLQKNDVLYIPSIHDLTDVGTIEVFGEVARPGAFPYADNTTLEDIIIKAGGLLTSASTVRVDVTRQIIDGKSTELSDIVSEQFTFALKDGFVVDGQNNFLLKPYDQIYVRKSPTFQKPNRVIVEGEVLYDGEYTITKKAERLSDLIKKAGGLTQYAYVKGARLVRKMNNEEYERARNVVSFANRNATDSINIKSLRLTREFNVGIDLEKAVAEPGSDADIVLRADDKLIIPEYNNTILISGCVMAPNTVSFVNNKAMKYYIEQAGGFSQNAKRKKTYIVYMNGQIKRGKLTKAALIEPGCEIIVPQKDRNENGLQNILSVATTSASLATMIASIANIIK